MTQTKHIPAMPPDTRLIQLDNGLTVITREDHSAPVVSAQAWCMAGSVHEGRWLGAGLSHVLEHMLFKGTTTRPASRIDQEVQEAGGYMNAYTSFDRTVYHIDVPNTGATVAIDILCDIMQHATLPSDELAKELDVIRREMDMGQDDPARRSAKRLFETAYVRSPYRFSIIGLPDIFNSLQPEDIRTYYREKYVPNNLFFTVAGDMKHDDVVQQIREAFSTTKAKPLPPVVLPEEPRQMASREIVEEAPVELGHFHYSWHIPELRHPDVPALDVLAVLLGGGRSSRLFQQVRERKGLAHSIDAWTYSPGNPGLIGVSGVVDAGNFDAARDAILAELDQVRTNPVTAEEVGKAVKQFVSATLSARKTMQGQASDLGASWLAANDLNFSERYLTAVQRVTPEDVQRVANMFLTEANRTLYALLPKGTSPRLSAEVGVTADLEIERIELANGVRLLVKPDHRLPFVEFRTLFLGGVLAESINNSGITQLMSRTLLKGTPTRDAETIMREIESVGGHLDSYGGNNSFGVNAEVLSDDFPIALDLLTDVLRHAAFPEGELERERMIQLAAIRDRRDHLLRSCMAGMRRALFGQRSYGLDSLGEEAAVGSIRADDIRSYHKRLAAPQNCVLAVFGDVQTETVRQSVEQAFGDWKTADDAPTLASSRTATGQSPTLPARVTEPRDKKQTVLVLGFPATTFDAPDRFALDLLQEACSDLGSRLFLRIREKLGLAYYVGAQHMPGLLPGYFAFYCGTAPEKVEQVEKEILKEIGLLRDEGLAEEELKRAKAKVVGQRKIARQDLGSFATMVALDELYGLGFKHYLEEEKAYEAVTLKEVREAAQMYLREEAMALALVGGLEK